MRVIQTRLSGLMLIEPRVRSDERGFFVETFSLARYREAGIAVDLVQDNHSRSRQGTLRGLHYQLPPGQAKLVRCARGRIHDVVVDIRRSSPTFGQHESFELDDVEHRQLFVPAGFAHGFCAMSPEVDVVYRVSSYYDAVTEVGIAWNDPGLKVAWPVDAPLVSERDRALPRLADVGPAQLF
jgi:dTDP-4-dehydrorhamnose 3,5-epimerase